VRLSWLHIGVAIIIAVAALLFVRLHNAGGSAPGNGSSVISSTR
jgi:hypothetical protein